MDPFWTSDSNNDLEYTNRKSKGIKKWWKKSSFKISTDGIRSNEVYNDDKEPEAINENTSAYVVNSDSVSDEEEFEERYDSITLDGIMKVPPQVQVLSPEIYEPEADKNIFFEDKIQKETPSPIKEKEIYNVRALSKNAATYQLEKFEKNALIVFNQENIEGYKPRLGTEKDVAVLKSSFGKYGFEVVEHKDLTKDEVFRELKEFSERDFTDYGCVAVAVLTHGTKNGLLRAKDQLYSEIEIINHFKVHDKPTLVTKPKILIIQACRGTKGLEGVLVHLGGKIRKDLDEDVEPYTLPVEADMLILHSSYIGNPSHRDELHGSWFIQSLCNKIDQLATTQDFESIITEVKREVAVDKYHEEYNRRTLQMDINKQMPVMTSTLIRKLYFKRFGDKSSEEKISANITESSRNDVLDTAAPNTPLLVQFGPCSCFLDHFNYIRACLRYFLEDNPNDLTAQSFLEVADTFEEGVEFNTAKETMSKAICNHLIKNARHHDYFKFLYFYKNYPFNYY